MQTLCQLNPACFKVKQSLIKISTEQQQGLPSSPFVTVSQLYSQFALLWLAWGLQLPERVESFLERQEL
jgi:hypothetical protein